MKTTAIGSAAWEVQLHYPSDCDDDGIYIAWVWARNKTAARNAAILEVLEANGSYDDTRATDPDEDDNRDSTAQELRIWREVNNLEFCWPMRMVEKINRYINFMNGGE